MSCLGLPCPWQFGPGDLKIMLARGANKTKATSKLVDYARPPGAKSVFSKGEDPWVWALGRSRQVVIEVVMRGGDQRQRSC